MMKWFVKMEVKAGGAELVHEFTSEPEEYDLDRMAREAGYTDGDAFPQFDIYHGHAINDDNWTAGGGGLESGRVGEPFED